MRWYLPTAFACLAIMLTSCGGFGLAWEEPLVEDIGLVACDTTAQMAIRDFRPGGSGLVYATVFAVGWDDSHIIAKRHPFDDFKIDKTQTEYFIVSVRERRAYGPFDAAEFQEQCAFHGVSVDLQFTRVFKKLE